MWVVQVGNREEGVKNLSVVQAKKKMEITAADSPVIVCGVESAGAAGAGEAAGASAGGTRACPASLPPGMFSGTGLEAIVSPA